MSSDLFPTERETSGGDFVAWAKARMTRGIRALEDHAEEIALIGVQAVQSQIEAFDRIDPEHDFVKDGPESMIDGVKSSINKSRTDGQLSIRVGWDLTQYRDGYPELQDKGFQDVVGMQALAYGKMAMKEAALKALEQGS